MRVVSISVNGLRQAIEKGFFEWLAGQDADVVCVQDHRVRVFEVEEDPSLVPAGYQAFFFDGEDDEDGGVGIYTRHLPKAIIHGFDSGPADRHGRFIQADFDRVSVVSVLAPCALEDNTRQAEKDEFMDSFMGFMGKTLRKRRQYIVCAALHTAHHVTDTSARFHKMEVSGFLPHERAWLDELFDEMGYVDAFRAVSLSGGQYTWWPEWARNWRRQSGWRTDYQILSPGLRRSLEDGVIDADTRFSDHAPLIMDYAIPRG
ncbi:MAG: exodeoxyribonuclease III [Oleiphilaceae bacterium]|nr:exodeoxyribonuclease III [Oleiphilaceae bacterium]